MQDYLALIGSFVIGGLMLIAFLDFDADLKNHSFEHTTDLIVQQNAAAMIDLVEWDFRKIGYGLDFPALAIYDSNFISYYVDLGGDGVIDTVRYFVSDSSAASMTTNPRDRIFYRLSNQDPNIDAAMGVTDFHLQYYDISGNPTTNLLQIKTIEVSLTIESTEPYNGEYRRFFWREKITPPNLLPYDS